MKLLRLGLASSAVLSLLAFSHGCANNSDDCAYTADCHGSSNAGKGGTGGTSADGGSSGGGESGFDGSGGASGSGGGQSGGSGGSGGEGCDGSKSPSEEECLLATNEYGVFVSPLGDASEGDGTRENPYATLSAAILAAKAEGKAVFACASEGAYEELLQLGEASDGTRLYGGFSCADWTYDAEARTVVSSPTSTGLRVSDLVEGLLIEDFEIIASDATQAGGSSMGGFVTNSANVVLRRVSLTAGEGADGEDGAGTTEKAESGAAGNPGTAACTVPTGTNMGAEQVITYCKGVATNSIGGKGGDGGNNDSTAGNGDTGKPAGGIYGEGQGDPDNWSCSVSNDNGGGDTGGNGTSQGTGNGGSGMGGLVSSGFLSTSGGSGLDGTVGKGGGGGGGAMAPAICPNGNRTGASGGSGGGGGCGGAGGKGGKGGGGSIALASVDSTIVLSSSWLIARSGGAGGRGGPGQPGGDGGEAGKGADGGDGSCAGGRGGKGGNGGHGGGGIGGPSVGIAYVGEEPVQMQVSITVAPVPASGGLDGGGMTTGAGENGLVAKSQSFSSE